MCGILGTNQKPLKSFKDALSLLNHRGPDHLGITEVKNNYFGHTRLAIIDLDTEANQPMVFDSITITFNGEIYNFKELQVAHNLHCITQSDTEVLIRLYQKYGTDFVHLLKGMFAFCIYDSERDRFFCARDRFGKKPFYYYYKNKQFIYASEIKAILALLKTTPPMNYKALSAYLSYLSPTGKETFYQSIFKLEAGKSFVIEKHNFHYTTYYELSDFIKPQDETLLATTQEEALTTIEDHLISSMNYRLVSDEPIASFLSGGLDSSLISALYSKISGKKIDTFSIGYDSHKHYCELTYAKQVSKHIHSNHHEIIMNKIDFLETIDVMLEHLDEPMGDSASIPTYILSKAVHKEGIKVALSGEGSDECFLGYDPYFKLLKLYELNTHLNESDKQTLLAYHHNNFNLSKDWEYYNRLYNNQIIFGSTGETFTQAQKNLLYSQTTTPATLKQYQNKSLRPDQWVSYIDYKQWVSEVLMSKLDRMSMANSLELRAPFLDHDLIHYVINLPASIRQGNTNKELLKIVANKYLPQSIIHRQKKGFSSPYIEWLYEAYDKDILETILLVNRELDIWNTEFINYLFQEARNGKFKQHIWNLYIFARWYKKTYL